MSAEGASTAPTVVTPDAEEEAGLRDILRQAPVLLVAFDRRGRPLRVEGGLRARRGAARPAPPAPGAELLDRFDEPPLADALARALRGRRLQQHVQLEERDLEVHFFPWQDDAAGGRGSVALAVDVTDRERALRELRESEERLRLISEHVGEMISEQGPDGRFFFVSRSLADALGTTREALAEERALDRMHPEDRPATLEHLRRSLREGVPVRTRARLRRGDGAWSWTESVTRIFHTAEGRRHSVSVTRDVRQEREEEERRDRELHLLEQASAIGGGLVACPGDALEARLSEALARTGRCAGARRAVLVLLDAQGGPRRHLTWSADPDAPPPDLAMLTELARAADVQAQRNLQIPDLAEAPEPLRDYARARGLRAGLAFPLRTGDGASGLLLLARTDAPGRWREEEVDVLHLLADALAEAAVRLDAEQVLRARRGLQSEITALARRLLGVRPEDLDRELRAGLALAARVAGLESALIAAWNPQDRRLLEVHQSVAPAEERVDDAHVRRHAWIDAHMQRGEVVALHARDVFPAEAPQTLRPTTRALLIVPIEMSEHSAAYLTAWSGADRAPFSRAEMGRFRLVGELLAGALRRRRTERALRESEEQLTQTQKMETVGRLAGHIAHDFNNLLTVIAGNAEVLAPELSDPAERDDAEAIRRAAARATQLTRDLLAFSRRRPPAHEVVRLNDVARGVGAFLERTLGDDIHLELRLRPEAGNVRVETDRLRQILVNLALNGRDAMPKGGRLFIETRATRLSAPQAERLGVRAPGHHAVLEVRDEGVGMEEGVRARAFEPFFTTRRSGSAVGLGLSIAYSTLREHGGAVEIESAPGAGTCVRLLLPQTPRADGAAAADEADGAGSGAAS